MTIQHTEQIVLRGGEGRLRLLQGPIDTALLWDNAPVAMAWSPPAGAGLRSFVRAYDLEDLEQEHLVRHVTDTAHLSALLRPLLAFLSDGEYRLEWIPTPDVSPGRGADVDHVSGRLTEWFGLHEVHDDDPLLVGTVPRELLEKSLISDLATWIHAGGRPAVVVIEAEDDDVGFLISGHTVLEAYRRVGMPPTMLRIVALTPEGLEATAGSELLTRAYRHIADLVNAQYQADRDLEARQAARG